ncbi:MAG: homoserine O-acetyltransferase [Bacteroidia bacterium]|nr:homoserine O-acetyltransferase [Bacteroidia bacterium]
MQTHFFHYTQPFQLESGEILPELTLAYATLGKINAQRNNVVWFCHALTANAIVPEWWPGMIGEGLLFDPDRDFLICANMPGSCYGSTNALSLNPATGEPYYHHFPLLTNRDMVRAFDLLREYLNIHQIRMILGGSLGGQQALEWSIMKPELFEYLIPIATNAQHSPWGIAFNESQRLAIQADETWKNASPDAGLAGMRAARSVALLSYRGYYAYGATQTEPTDEKTDDFLASSYQRYQGDKLVKRFHTFAYWTLSKAMDSHHLGRGRGGVVTALRSIKAKTMVVGLDSDILFPVEEQKLLAQHIPDALYREISSNYGHDGFLIETEKITNLIREFVYQ